MSSFFCNVVSIVLMIIYVILFIAFFTLLERKILAYIQNQNGLTKVGYGGFLQPFCVGLKILSKKLFVVVKSEYYLYYLSSLMLFMFIMLMLGMVLLMLLIYTNLYYLKSLILLLVVFMSLSSYIVLFLGWFSNSTYSMMSTLGSVLQMISYEGSFILIMLLVKKDYGGKSSFYFYYFVNMTMLKLKFFMVLPMTLLFLLVF